MRIRCSIVLLLVFANWSLAKESTDKPYAGSTQPPLAPGEAQKKFKVPEGFEVRLFAAEPEVVNPVAMSFDEKGGCGWWSFTSIPMGPRRAAKGAIG